MKNKILMMAIAMIFLVIMINGVNAEIWSWQTTVLDYQKNIVRHHAYYQLQDTSEGWITVGESIPIEIMGALNNNLPLNLTQTYPQFPNAIVDWCNLTVVFVKNTYDLDYNGVTTYKILNTTYNYYNVFWQNINATFIDSQFNLRARDSIIVDADCHYTNNDSMFYQNNYIADSQAFFPAYECKGCSIKSFEIITQENKKLEDRISQETGVYTNIQNVVDKNYLIWQILSWFVKIGLIFLAISLIFLAMYYFYLFFKSIGDKIK